MTVKKLTAIENGRLVPTDIPVDADLLEVSKLEGNKIQVKEDGLYFKERLVKDGLEYTGEYLGIEDYSIDLKKIAKTSSTASSTEVTPDTLQSLEEHLANLYGYVQRLKGEVTENSGSTLYGASGVLSTSPKIFIGYTTANSGGDWSIDFSHVGFTEIPTVVAMGQNVGTALADKRFASLNQNQPTKTGCSGKLLSSSSSSASLLAAMTMVHGAGPVHIVAIGF